MIRFDQKEKAVMWLGVQTSWIWGGLGEVSGESVIFLLKFVGRGRGSFRGRLGGIRR
jgi:hypothetical protein